MKKFLTLCLLCLFTIAAFSFAGCTSNQKFTVTFDSNGGTYIESRVVEEGETIYKPSNPERQAMFLMLGILMIKNGILKTKKLLKILL